MFITIGLTNKECDTTHAPAALPFGFTPTEQLGVQTPGCRMVAPAGRLPDAAAELPPGSCTSSRLGGGAAKPRCCAALALTQPPPAKGFYASTRCPAETATLIKIRVFFRELSYVRIHVFMIDVSSPYHKFAYLGRRE